MLSPEIPAMSAILMTPDKASRLHKTLDHLRRQTIADQLEIVLVAPKASELEPDQVALEGFHSVQVVEMGRAFTLGEGYVAAIKQAQAPIVVMCEDHSWPAPDWAERLLAAHAQPYAAVGPALTNANPESALGWADLFVCFGPWVDPAPSGVLPSLAGHNTSYKRTVLLDFGDDLVSKVEPEVLLHAQLREAGHQLFLEGEAKTAHVNFSSIRALLIKQAWAGRRYASHRSQRWPRRRCLLYFLGSPLLPFLGLRRTLKEARRPGRYPGSPLKLVPAMLVGLTAHAFGEMAGYAFGGGDASMRLSHFELNVSERS